MLDGNVQCEELKVFFSTQSSWLSGWVDGGFWGDNRLIPPGPTITIATSTPAHADGSRAALGHHPGPRHRAAELSKLTIPFGQRSLV